MGPRYTRTLVRAFHAPALGRRHLSAREYRPGERGIKFPIKGRHRRSPDSAEDGGLRGRPLTNYRFGIHPRYYTRVAISRIRAVHLCTFPRGEKRPMDIPLCGVGVTHCIPKNVITGAMSNFLLFEKTRVTRLEFRTRTWPLPQARRGQFPEIIKVGKPGRPKDKIGQ